MSNHDGFQDTVYIEYSHISYDILDIVTILWVRVPQSMTFHTNFVGYSDNLTLNSLSPAP